MIQPGGKSKIIELLIIIEYVVRMLNGLGIRWMVDGREATWSCSLSCPAWPGCPPGTSPQSPGLAASASPPPGWGWSPSRSGGWHKLAPPVQVQPV